MAKGRKGRKLVDSEVNVYLTSAELLEGILADVERIAGRPDVLVDDFRRLLGGYKNRMYELLKAMKENSEKGGA